MGDLVEVLKREENMEEFTWIFHIVQETFHSKLLKMLKSSPNPPSSSLPEVEALADSDDPDAALRLTAVVAISKKRVNKEKNLSAS